MNEPKELLDRLELLDTLKLKGKTCVEVGVLKGEFSEQIMKRDPFCLYLVDPWEKQPYEDYTDFANYGEPNFDECYYAVMQKFADNPRVEIVRAYSHEAAKIISQNNLDMVYIDGNHSFHNCFLDLCIWSQKIKDGGWLCGHDMYNTVFIGVIQAVNAFCRITGYKQEYMTNENWGSFAIRITDPPVKKIIAPFD